MVNPLQKKGKRESREMKTKRTQDFYILIEGKCKIKKIFRYIEVPYGSHRLFFFFSFFVCLNTVVVVL